MTYSTIGTEEIRVLLQNIAQPSQAGILWVSSDLRNGHRIKSEKTRIENNILDTSSARLKCKACTPKAWGPGSIPGWVTRSHMLQLRPCAANEINILK